MPDSARFTFDLIKKKQIIKKIKNQKSKQKINMEFVPRQQKPKQKQKPIKPQSTLSNKTLPIDQRRMCTERCSKFLVEA